jgi:signal peptidase I
MLFAVISSKMSGGEPSLFGYQFKTVLSGSMEPTFDTGSIIVVKPSDKNLNYQKGDIITFKKDESTIVTHRIIDVIKNKGSVLYKTKGDNNEDPDSDPVLSQNVLAEYTGLTIPYLGYFQDFTKSKNGVVLLLILPGVLLLMYSIITIYKALRELDQIKKPKDIEKTV